MTKPEAVDPPIMGLSVTTTFRELIPLLPLVDSIETEQPMVASRTGELHAGLRSQGAEPVHTSAIESRLLSYAFEGPVPGQLVPTDTASTPQPATFAGRVAQPDGTPVSGATVALLGGGDSTSTSDSGQFLLRNAAPGPHMLVVRRLGFRAVRLAVTIGQGGGREVAIKMTPSVAVLPAVTTTAQVDAAYHDVGLDKRMHAGVGQYVTYDQIVQRQATKFTQILELVRGLNMYSYSYPDPTTRVSGMRGKGSCVGFVVDGVPARRMLTAHDVDDIISPDNVAAVEYYRSSEVPAGMRAEAPATDTLPATNSYFDSIPPSKRPAAGQSGSFSNSVQPPTNMALAFKQTCDVVAV